MARATERYSQKIHTTVYLAGAMLTSGMSQTEVAEEYFRDTSKDAQYNFGKGEHNPPTSCWPSLEIVTQAYYNCCSFKVRHPANPVNPSHSEENNLSKLV